MDLIYSEHPVSTRYSSESSTLAFEKALEIISDFCSEQKDLIFEGLFLSQSRRKAIQETCKNCEAIMIYCYADLSICENRFVERIVTNLNSEGNGEPTLPLATLIEFHKMATPPLKEEFKKLIILDTSKRSVLEVYSYLKLNLNLG